MSLGKVSGFGFVARLLKDHGHYGVYSLNNITARLRRGCYFANSACPWQRPLHWVAAYRCTPWQHLIEAGSRIHCIQHWAAAAVDASLWLRSAARSTWRLSEAFCASARSVAAYSVSP